MVDMLPTTKPIWGLDIAASAIKGVRMRVEEDRVQILDADILSFEGEPPATESLGRDRRIWQALQRFETKYEVSADRVAIGLPGSVFFTRPFNVFLVGDRTESELVRFELEQHIPFGLDAVVWDYEVFEPTDQNVREREGLLFAMKKEVLNNYLLSLSAAHIQPLQIQAAPLALYNFVRYELDCGEPTLVADIGAGGTNILAIAGSCYWVRTINAGGETMTTAIRNAFRPRDLSFEQAESIKTRIAELSRRAEMVERLMPPLRAFVGEMRNAIKHLSQEHKLTFKRLVLFGGASRMYGLQRLLADELNIRVVSPAGLGRIQVAAEGKAAYVNDNLTTMATAIGLGLQGIGQAATRVNMVRATLRRQRSETLVRRAAAIALVAVATLVILFGVFSVWRKSIYVTGIENVRAILMPIKANYDIVRKATTRGESEARLATLERMAQGRGVWLTVLDKVARMLPPDNDKLRVPATEKVWLLRLSLKAKAGQAGVYEGEIEAGTRLRPDGTHTKFAERTLITPLERDERGIFRNVSGFEAAARRPTLSWSGGSGPDQYFLVRLKFEVALPKGDGS